MSVFASLLRTAYRVSGAKKAFALPEDKIVPVIEKQNRHRGVFVPTDRNAYYETIDVSGFPCLIVREKPQPAKRAILYFFSGGMVIGPDKGDLPVMRKLGRDTGCDVWFPFYPLCTEHCITTSYAMVYECYRRMIDLYGGGNVSTCGFSSGGALALGIAAHNNALGAPLPPPRHIVAVSPGEVPWNDAEKARMHGFFRRLDIREPIFVGASDGGMVSQIYVQKYPGETGGLILISTGGMDENTLKSLKRKYLLAPVMLWYMKRCNYEKLKPRLIKAGMSHLRNESAEEVAYAQNMFETIFKDYPQAKDVHISSLLADLMNQKPVTAADFEALQGKILLILPDQDFFSGQMQQDLIRLMHQPKIAYVSGGHLSTVLKTEDYLRTIHDFLDSLN